MKLSYRYFPKFDILHYSIALRQVSQGTQFLARAKSRIELGIILLLSLCLFYFKKNNKYFVAIVRARLLSVSGTRNFLLLRGAI